MFGVPPFQYPHWWISPWLKEVRNILSLNSSLCLALLLKCKSRSVKGSCWVLQSSMDTTCENLFQCCSFVGIVLVFRLFRGVRLRNVLPPSSLLMSDNLVCLSTFVISLPQLRIYVRHLGRADSYVSLIFNFISILRAIARSPFIFRYILSTYKISKIWQLKIFLQLKAAISYLFPLLRNLSVDTDEVLRWPAGLTMHA